MTHPDSPHQRPDPLRRRLGSDLPVTGAWRVGDDPAERQFFTFATPDRPFVLEGGGALSEVRVAYETWGELDEAASNAVLICHALTGDAHAAGEHSHTAGWWNDTVGKGKAIDTDRYFVVCSNVLGGCQGTTGPADTPPPEAPNGGDSAPHTRHAASAPGDTASNPGRTSEPHDPQRPYGARFPTVTIRDMVRVQARLAQHLGVARWLAVAGGSMGGMQVLEWALMYPRRVASILPLATCAAASPWQIAWSALGRTAIAADPHWAGGDYYHQAEGPWRGLAIARELAQVTYRSGASFDRRFHRARVPSDDLHDLWGRYQIESYLDHHGQKLVRRFDANSYLILNKAMDTHDIGRGRGLGDPASALALIDVPTLTASVSSDVLYPPYQQRDIHEGITAAGGDCRYVMLQSDEGHDGFLLEHELLHEPISSFLDEMYHKTPPGEASKHHV